MVKFYFDENMRRVVADALMQKGYSVIMAVDIGMVQKDDDVEHLPYATENGFILVTLDHPFASRTMTRTDFYALVCISHNIRTDVGRMVEVLDESAQLFDPERDTKQVHWLPWD